MEAVAPLPGGNEERQFYRRLQFGTGRLSHCLSGMKFPQLCSGGLILVAVILLYAAIS